MKSTGEFSLDDLSKIVQMIAILLGLLGAYVTFFRGRTYKGRLAPSVSGTTVANGGTVYLTVSASLKNLGLSQVKIQPAGSGLRLHSCLPIRGAPGVVSAEWDHVASFRIFQAHEWLESKESVNETRLIAIPDRGQVALQLELWVASKGLVWKTMSIVNLEPKKVQQPGNEVCHATAEPATAAVTATAARTATATARAAAAAANLGGDSEAGGVRAGIPP